MFSCISRLCIRVCIFVKLLFRVCIVYFPIFLIVYSRVFNKNINYRYCNLFLSFKCSWVLIKMQLCFTLYSTYVKLRYMYSYIRRACTTMVQQVIFLTDNWKFHYVELHIIVYFRVASLFSCIFVYFIIIYRVCIFVFQNTWYTVHDTRYTRSSLKATAHNVITHNNLRTKTLRRATLRRMP